MPSIYTIEKLYNDINGHYDTMEALGIAAWYCGVGKMLI